MKPNSKLLVPTQPQLQHIQDQSPGETQPLCGGAIMTIPILSPWEVTSQWGDSCSKTKRGKQGGGHKVLLCFSPRGVISLYKAGIISASLVTLPKVTLRRKRNELWIGLRLLISLASSLGSQRKWGNQDPRLWLSATSERKAIVSVVILILFIDYFKWICIKADFPLNVAHIINQSEYWQYDRGGPSWHSS